jgi:integrase
VSYVYSSIFTTEINNYLNLVSEAGRSILKIQSTLRGLDKYLLSLNLEQKALDAETITAWLRTRTASVNTKAVDIIRLRGFVKYLVSLGIAASCPETPKRRLDYVPYMFSDVEIERIISIADNFKAGKRLTRTSLIFPILLRVLYGCGLRLGEGRSLRWKDVDLVNGILTIREAKNLKQRFVPVDESVSNLLKNYKAMTHRDNICDDYLFESNLNPGKPFQNNTFYEWFKKVQTAAGIHYTKHTQWERGPCPHCLRHRFTLMSFLKSESEGRRFEDTAPFLAAYLGHDSPTETEAYLKSSHSIYTQSHQRVDAAIGHLFPEVYFDED